MTKEQLENEKHEACEVYIDCWIDWEKAVKRRNLNYMGNRMSIDECYEVAKQAVPGYNCYETEEVFGVLKKKNLNVECALAREGSVALYFYGDKKELDKIKESWRDLQCDECDFVNNEELRVWWD